MPNRQLMLFLRITFNEGYQQMARRIPASELEAIEDAVRCRPGGASFSEIVSVCPGLAARPLQARIKKLVDAGCLVRKGARRGARYFMPGEISDKVKSQVATDTVTPTCETGLGVPLSKAGEEVRQLVARPHFIREPVGYDAYVQGVLAVYELKRKVCARATLHAIACALPITTPGSTHGLSDLG